MVSCIRLIILINALTACYHVLSNLDTCTRSNDLEKNTIFALQIDYDGICTKKQTYHCLLNDQRIRNNYVLQTLITREFGNFYNIINSCAS